MLRSSGPAPKPDIQRAIEAILKEDATFDRTENRSAHRESLVRAISLEIRDPEETVSGFSRNISATGVGVIHDQEIREKATAVLTIERLGDTKPTILLSECRWCRPYGKKWFLSGWQFISLKR